jgi:uncharacterized DUF497 family protein
MKRKSLTYEYSSEKNNILINERGISFEEIVAALNNDKLLDVLVHHNSKQYPNQKIYVVDIDGYAYLVPFVKKDEQVVFLKTIFPSRRFTKKYLDARGVL